MKNFKQIQKLRQTFSAMKANISATQYETGKQIDELQTLACSVNNLLKSVLQILL